MSPENILRTICRGLIDINRSKFVVAEAFNKHVLIVVSRFQPSSTMNYTMYIIKCIATCMIIDPCTNTQINIVLSKVDLL